MENKKYLYNVKIEQLREYLGCKAGARIEYPKGSKIVKGVLAIIKGIDDREVFVLGSVMLNGTNISEMEIIMREEN